MVGTSIFVFGLGMTVIGILWAAIDPAIIQTQAFAQQNYFYAFLPSVWSFLTTFLQWAPFIVGVLFLGIWMLGRAQEGSSP